MSRNAERTYQRYGKQRGVRRILLNGDFVSVLEKGKGYPVLFLHGYLSDKRSFYYQTEYFSSNGFKAVAPDFIGFGASSPLKDGWSVGDYANWLADFIREKKLCRPHIVAHSFGARVALKALAEDNGLADKLVITGGAGLVKPRSPQYIRRVKTYRAVKKFFPRLAEKKFGSEEYRTLSPVMKESYKKIVNEDLRGCARLIKNRALLIYGSGDTVTTAKEEGATFHSLIEGSQFKIISGGHFCFCENAEEFNRLTLNFLTE